MKEALSIKQLIDARRRLSDVKAKLVVARDSAARGEVGNQQPVIDTIKELEGVLSELLDEITQAEVSLAAQKEKPGLI